MPYPQDSNTYYIFRNGSYEHQVGVGGRRPSLRVNVTAQTLAVFLPYVIIAVNLPENLSV